MPPKTGSRSGGKQKPAEDIMLALLAENGAGRAGFTFRTNQIEIARSSSQGEKVKKAAA